MAWYKLYRIPISLGGVLICGGCVARTCFAEKANLELSSDRNDAEIDGLTLKQVQVFFRHGARTPIHLTPNIEQVSYDKTFHNRVLSHTHFDLDLRRLDGGKLEASPLEASYGKVILKGGMTLGSLTTLGQQQTYDLGRRLKQDYVHKHKLLESTFNPEDIFVRSTNVNRTINSARCVLAGMYGAQYSSARALIHMSKTATEVLWPNPHHCTLVRTLNHAAMIHFDSIPGIKEDRLLIEKVLDVSSEKLSKKLNFIDIRDDLVARMAHGLPVPDKLLPHLPMIDNNATRILFHATCGQHEAEKVLAARMSGGPAMTLAVDSMKNFVQHKTNHKLCLYSAHDSLLLPLTVILGVYDDKWPPYAADIRMELYTDQHGEYFVRVLYCGKVQKVRGCEKTVCKFADFLKSLDPYLIQPGEYNKLCDSRILEKIARDLLVHEKDEEKEERSDVAAGL